MRERHAELARRDVGYVWGVFRKSDNAVLGWVDIYVFDRGDAQTANFGYLLHNQHWGKGYGPEAARAMAKVAFTKLKLHWLEAAVKPANRRSLKLARAIGFRRLGVQKNYEWSGTKWVDKVIFVATPKDFGLPESPPKYLRKW